MSGFLHSLMSQNNLYVECAANCKLPKPSKKMKAGGRGSLHRPPCHTDKVRRGRESERFLFLPPSKSLGFTHLAFTKAALVSTGVVVLKAVARFKSYYVDVYCFFFGKTSKNDCSSSREMSLFCQLKKDIYYLSGGRLGRTTENQTLHLKATT